MSSLRDPREPGLEQALEGRDRFGLEPCPVEGKIPRDFGDYVSHAPLVEREENLQRLRFDLDLDLEAPCAADPGRRGAVAALEHDLLIDAHAACELDPRVEQISRTSIAEAVDVREHIEQLQA